MDAGRREDGVRQVADAGAAMDRITSEVRKVNELIVAISAATREQTTGVTQGTEAVSLLDQGTQQNAALVEQSAAAALSLNNQAHQLVSAVAMFRSGG